MEEERKDAYTSLGVAYGLIMGAAIPSLLFVLTNDPIYFSYMSVGLVIGLAIGYNQESKKKPM